MPGMDRGKGFCANAHSHPGQQDADGGCDDGLDAPVPVGVLVISRGGPVTDAQQNGDIGAGIRQTMNGIGHNGLAAAHDADRKLESRQKHVDGEPPKGHALHGAYHRLRVGGYFAIRHNHPIWPCALRFGSSFFDFANTIAVAFIEGEEGRFFSLAVREVPQHGVCSMSTEPNRSKKRIFADLVALHHSINSQEDEAAPVAAEAPLSAGLRADQEEGIDSGYELFCEHLPMGVLLAEVTRDRYRRPEKFTTVKVNMAYARMLGLARVNVLEKDFLAVLPGGEADWKESLMEVAGKGRIAKGTAYWDATDTLVNVTLFLPRHDLLAVVIDDANASISAVGSVAQHEGVLNSIMQASPDLVCRFMPDGTLTYANRAYCEYFKKIREELVGHCFLDEIPEDSVEFVRSRLSMLTRGHPSVTYQHRFEQESGTRWVEWRDVALFDDDGALVEYQSHGRDVTAQRQDSSETARVGGYMEDLLHYRAKQHNAVATQATETKRSSEALSGEVEALRAEIIRLQGRTITGELDVCSSCNRIHDDEGNWMVVPMFLESHTAAQVGAKVCPYCHSRAERELERQERKRKRD